MSLRRSVRCDAQGGYALISVVILVGLTALVVSALLGLLFTSIATQADSVRSERELRALDGAMDAAINQLRFDFNSASRDACRLEPPVQRITRMVFDNATPATGDDVPVDIQCQGSVNSAGGSTADQVRLVGAGGYSGAVPWTTSSWWPTGVGVTVADLTASRPNLIHRGSAPLQFGTGVTVRNSAAVVRTPLTDSPAVELSGDYVQGGVGPGATDGGCGQLATAGSPMRITDLIGTSSPECGLAPEDLQLDDDPTGAMAGFRRPIARPPTLPPCGASVVTLREGRYGSSDMFALNALVNRSAPGASPTCAAATTFHFTPGVYVFTGDQLVFDRPGAFFVMGVEKGWSGTGGVAAATAARQDVLAELCDTSSSGVTFVLPPQFRLRHLSGRLSMCPAFSENPGQPPLPAIYQETSYANRLLQLPGTTWSKSFRPSNAAPVSTCFNNTLELAPPAAGGRLDVLDGPGVGARPAVSASFPESDRLPAVGTNQCRVGRTFSARVDTVDPRPLSSARLLVRGFESLTTPANLIVDRRIMVTVRRGANRICTTSAQPGIGNGQWEASIDLMTGSCAVPRSCTPLEGLGLNPRCLDPRTAVAFLPAASTNALNASAPNAEQRLTSALLADADLEVTQYLTFSTNFAGFPVFPQQSYTVESVQLVTNNVTTSMLGPVANGPDEAPFRRGYDNVNAVITPAGIATPQMPDNSTVTSTGLQTNAGVPCGYLLCPVVVPAGTRPGRSFVHTVDLGESSIQIPPEYTAVDIDPNLSSLRLRLRLLPDHCPGEADAKCPLLAPVQLPILGAVDVNDYVRQSYFGTEVKVRVALRVHDGSAVRTRCVETTGILGATTDVAVDLLDVNRIIDGDRLPDDGCDNVEIDSMRDLRLTAVPAASGLNRVGLSVQMQLPCLRDYFANSSWKCVSWTDAGRNVVFQVRPPSIQEISLLAASDTISGAPATSSVNVNARTPATGVSATSFNVYGRVWMPRSNLDVFWNGDVTEGRPLVRDELVVGALGSQITAPPIRPQVGIPDADRYLVCCDARRAESRDVKLIATAPSGKQLVTLVRFTDVIEGEVGEARYFPGYRVEIRDWQTCDEGRCSPS